MQRSGTASWRFEEDNAQALHFALFVRDTLKLPVESAEDIPPPLSPEPADRSEEMRSDLRSIAARQWAGWWRRLITQSGSGREILDPPGFLSLENEPAMRTAAIAAFSDFIRWFNRPKPSRPHGQPPGMFRHETIRHAAELTAAERDVPLSQLNAVVHVLQVQGTWSYQAAGDVLCSVGVPADPVAASAFLRITFASGL